LTDTGGSVIVADIEISQRLVSFGGLLLVLKQLLDLFPLLCLSLTVELV
jgi:hypothetical protein